MAEEEEGKSIFFEELGLCLSHLYLSAGKYFIYKKDRHGYLLRACKYAKSFKMTPLRLHRESL